MRSQPNRREDAMAPTRGSRTNSRHQGPVGAARLGRAPGPAVRRPLRDDARRAQLLLHCTSARGGRRGRRRPALDDRRWQSQTPPRVSRAQVKVWEPKIPRVGSSGSSTIVHPSEVESSGCRPSTPVAPDEPDPLRRSPGPAEGRPIRWAARCRSRSGPIGAPERSGARRAARPPCECRRRAAPGHCGRSGTAPRPGDGWGWGCRPAQ